MSRLREIASSYVHTLKPYQPGRPIEDLARELGLASADDIVKLASNENALGPSPRAIEAMKKAASRMHIYPDGGTYALREAISRHIGMPASRIFPGHGSNEVIQLLGHVFMSPNRSVVVSDYAFIVYRLVADLYQTPVISVPMQNYTHDLDAMLKAIRPDTALVFIANPNNPTGTMVSGDDIERFMDRLPDHVVAVFDEAYVELVPDDEQPDTLRYVREGRNVFVLRTFSKVFGLAGLRVGYAVAPEEGVDLLHHVRQPFNVSAIAQAAAIAALEDEAYLESSRKLVANGLKQLGKGLDDLGVPFIPSKANFLLVNVGDGQRIYEELQKRHVIVRPMSVYGLPQFVRVTVGTEAENDRFLRAVRDLKAGSELAVS